MNTFFISPLIPLKIYLNIQKEKHNLTLTNDESKLINNINILFDYSLELSENTIRLIESIVNKIDEYRGSNIQDKLLFVHQNTYREITNYNYLFYDLLKQRNYIQIINPYKYKKIGLSVGLSDIGPVSDVNTGLFKTLDDSDKIKFIDDLILDRDFKSKDVIHEIMSKSLIDSKINTITRILSNKSILYNLLENEDYIPISISFDINNDDSELTNIIEEFKSKNKSEYFVIKPSSGTLSDGLAIKKISDLTISFIKQWIILPENNKYAVETNEEQQYSTWMLSSFIQSFLWKLNGPSKTSIKFPEIKELQGKSFNDSIGRINKFRFWCLWTIIDGEFTSYLYSKGYSELALEELTDYSKTQLDPSNIEEYYQTLLNTEENYELFENIQNNGTTDYNSKKLEAATVGTYLDFARVVDETNYPLGKEAWNKNVIPGMYNIVNTMADKCKRYLSCLNKYSKSKDSGCFSYFALDILIDSESKPWLLEANSRPFVGFSDWWNRYDKNNEHCVNVKSFLNNVLSLTVDTVIPGGIINNNEDFLVTTEKDIIKRKKVYTPFTLGITDTSTSKVYNEMYNILDKNKYSSFPYAKYSPSGIGFRGMSPISKYLISKIEVLGKDYVINLLREIFPYDAKQKVLNKITSLGFYLGDKSELTKKIKMNVKNWDSIIPWTIIVDKNDSDSSLLSKMTETNIKTFIAKPSSGQQGIGIIISENKEYIIESIKKSNEDSWIISKYLDNPYLIKLNKTGISGVKYDDKYGRKSHLRIYVLLNKIDKKLNVYLYKKSLIFCAAKEYNSCDENNSEFCNLTNLYYGSLYYNNILKKDPGDAYKDLSGLTSELISNEEYKILIKSVKDIVQNTIKSIKNDLICLNYNNNCFQYIAFDFHLENENGIIKPWLLEVNATPGLKAPNYQLKDFGGLNNFLENILNITLDTSISKGNKQLFEFISLKKNYKDSIIIDELEAPFKNTLECVFNNTYSQLKQLMIEKDVKGRSKLTTKYSMCKRLIN